MTKLRIAFFKAQYGGTDDKIINVLTGGEGYSHSALVLDDGHTTIESHYLAGGVAICTYNNLMSDKRWVVLEKDFHIVQVHAAIEYAKRQVGEPYDLAGILLNYLFKWYDRKGMWCSELTCKAYKVATRYPPSGKRTLVFPNQHYKRLVNDGFKRKATTLTSTYGYKKELDYTGKTSIRSIHG